MSTVRDVLAALETIAPSRYAFSFDKIGLQVGNPDQGVTKAVVSLDRSLGAVRYAHDLGAELLLAHHPLIFNPMDAVDTRTHQGRTVIELIRQGTAFIAAHTNWDSAIGGINDCLAGLLGLQAVEAFGTAAEGRRLKLAVTCPPDSSEAIIDAASDAGAGIIGAYNRCAFQTEGTGTFFGTPLSNPKSGQAGKVERFDEVRVEMVLAEDRAVAVERALRKVHPYEAPAIDFFVLNGVREQPCGRVGNLVTPTTLSEFAALVNAKLDSRSWAWGDPSKKVKRVAVVGGAADGEWIAAQRAGADVLLTGEVKQHVAVEATESGMSLIAAGHYQTEHPGCQALRDRIAEVLPTIDWSLFTPPTGFYGRPQS